MEVRRGLDLIHTWPWNLKKSLIRNNRRGLDINNEDPALLGTANLYHTWKNLRRISQNEEKERQPLNFPWVLQVAHSASASKPLDKVYGLLAIMDPAISKHIRPDYTTRPGGLFIALVRRHIISSNSLKILREGNPWSKTNTLPWAPDWTWDGRNRENRLLRHASGSTAPSFSLSKNGRYLICRGIIVGMIDGLSAHEDGKTRVRRGLPRVSSNRTALRVHSGISLPCG